jgi:hypothetical protein
MKDLLELLYRFLGQYEDLDPVWQLYDVGGEQSGMLYGFLIMLFLGIAGAGYFYLVYTKYFANRAILKNWWKWCLFSAIAVFVLEELILAGIFTAADEEESNFFANLFADNGKLVLFSLFNAAYSFVIYFLSSLLFRHYSKNARYIILFRKNKNK